MSRVSQAFNDKSLKALKVEKRTSVPDPKTSGLQLRVSPANKKGRTPMVWYFNYWQKSTKKTQRIKIGSFEVIGLSEARSKAKLYIAEIERGNDPALEVRKRKKIMTFKELAADYLERHAKRKKKSWRDDERKLDADILPAIGEFKADEVEKFQIIDIIEEIYERGAIYQSNRTLSLLRKIYNWAEEEGLCENNPVRRVKRRGDEEERDRVLNDDEIRRFWHGLTSAPMEPGTQITFKIALLTGQRIGQEIAGAKVDEIDFTQGVWNIPKDRTKNKKPHLVPLSPAAINAFQQAIELANGSPFVFPSSITDGPIDEKAPTKAFWRYKQQDNFDIEDVRAHDLRRTAATGMTSLGHLEEVAGKVLNHRPVSVTGIHYNKHAYIDEKRSALEAWGSHVMSIVEKA